MALSSFDAARSVTELCLSPLFHYQYSSISKAIPDGLSGAALAKNKTQRTEVQKQLQALCLSYFTPQRRVVFQTDTTPIVKAHSPTLPERTYIAVPNTVIPGNKPISIGYETSFINVSVPNTKWSLPLSVQRVGIDQTASQKALEQLKQIFLHPALSNLLCLNTLDSKYGNAAYLSPAFGRDNLVNLVRLRAGMKVWASAESELETGGAPRIYGEKFYLHAQSKTKTYNKHPKTGQSYQVFQRSIFERKADEILGLETQTSSGRKLKVQIRRWRQLMIRSKHGQNMKDKAFDLLAIKVRDLKTGKPVFKSEMYVAISGRRKDEVSAEQGYQSYRRRYDIEPTLRFSKQRLFLDKLQTPNVQHFDNWLLINQMAVWLLYTASDEVDFRAKKWRQYLVQNTEVGSRLSIAQTRHATEALFLSFDANAFKPGESKKGRPRRKGEAQIQRTRYAVVKKTTWRAKTKLKTEKIE